MSIPVALHAYLDFMVAGNYSDAIKVSLRLLDLAEQASKDSNDRVLAYL